MDETKAFLVSHFRKIISSEFKFPMQHIGQFYVEGFGFVWKLSLIRSRCLGILENASRKLPKMTVFLLKLYFLCSLLLRIDITQVVCTKLKLKQYFPSLLTLVVEKRLTAHEQSAYWLFFSLNTLR